MADVEGREARIKFWKTIGLPLVVFGLIGRLNLITLVYLLLIFSRTIFEFIQNEDLKTFLQEVTAVGFYVIQVPNCCLWRSVYGEYLPERGTPAMLAYEDIMINTGLILVIFLYFLFHAGRNYQISPICMPYWALMGSTAYTVYRINKEGTMEYVDMAVYFKVVALIAVIFCAPHLYPGLNARHSSALLSFFAFGVIPMALCGVYILIEDNVLERDSIGFVVDECKLWLVFNLLALQVLGHYIMEGDRPAALNNN